MKIELKVGSQGHVYIPKGIREELLKGKKELEFHSDLCGGMLVPKDPDPEEVLGSLVTLQHHFQQMMSQKSERGNDDVRT